MDFSTLPALLDASLDPRQQKQAEDSIKQAEQAPGFSIALLKIVAAASYQPNTRLAAALYFKNFIRRNWVDEDGNHKLPADEVQAIKAEVVGLMVAVPANIQAQLGEAISVIADSDFWQRWDTLIDDLVSRLTPDNATVNNGVLQVAHSIFKRWRPLFRSDDLYTEINHVITKFCNPFLTLMENTDAAVTASQNNPDALRQAFKTLDLEMKLFYDLSCQDLPPPFEDNLGPISALLHKYLVYDSPALQADDDEAGVLEHVKAGIFEVLMLYVQKYDDAFGDHLNQFIGSAWSLLTSTGSETKNDILVSKALQFLTAVAATQHAATFDNADTLRQIVAKVIVPNLTLRESDVELFEDEPIEFIRRDLEGSDNDTRRRAATNFLRQLITKFEELVTNISKEHLEQQLQTYLADKQNNWKAKDTAVYLFSAVAASGTATAAQGVLSVNPHVNVLDFFQQYIAEDLQAPPEPILAVDAIKYVYIFRSQLTVQHWHSAFQLLVQQLGSENYVIHTYAAIAVERALFMTDSAGQPLIPKADVANVSRELLTHLFKLIMKNSQPEKLQENEFLMKCVMRVLIFIREGVVSVSDIVLTALVNILKVIRHNPSNPRFQYFLFEALGALIRYAGPTQNDKLEAGLQPAFMQILGEDIQEFAPYIFQLFAALVETNPSNQLSPNMKALVEPIVKPSVWESRGNTPALVRLLGAMVARDAEDIVAKNLVEAILGVFQKLVSTKVHEVHAFDLVEMVISNVPQKALEQYWITIMQLLLTRLSNMKTEAFQQRFVVFYHFISARQDTGLGTDFFVAVADQVQNDVFRPLYTQVILPNTQSITRPLDKKTAVISLTKSLTDSKAFLDRYPKGWPLTCQRLLELLVNPPKPPAQDDVIADQDVDEVGFGVGFTQLNTCKRPAKDPFPEITDVKAWVKDWLQKANVRHNGLITQLINDRLTPDVKQALGEYMS